MFARAEATLSQTSYRLRCWLKSYHTTLERLISCHLHQVEQATLLSGSSFSAMSEPSQRKRIYNLHLRPDKIRMTEHIVSLLDEVAKVENTEEDKALNNMRRSPQPTETVQLFISTFPFIQIKQIINILPWLFV